MAWLGLDIGGANLKVADGQGFAVSRSFPLWQQPENLAHELRSLIAESPATDRLAATMTGELADCFENKSVGVTAILDAVSEAADGRHARVYLTSGKLVTPEVARRQPILAAASNWHALACFTSRFVPEGKTGLLLDVGSTTTDFVPLNSDGHVAQGTTDTERLQYGELLYSGMRRNPVCGVVTKVPYRDASIPVAQELFATMLDVYIILGDLPEEPTVTATADGRPATKKYARTRLARTICADGDTFNHRDAVQLAQFVALSQQQMMIEQLQKAWQHEDPPDVVVLSGSGESVGKRVVESLSWPSTVVSLRTEFDAKVSNCGPAHAVAVLAAEGSKS